MNDPGVMQLQQEAALRVQRMAERSRRLVREHPVNIYRGVTLTTPAGGDCRAVVPKEDPCEPNVCEQTEKTFEKPSCRQEEKPREKDWLSFLVGDEERVLLLLLILVLGHNGAPVELLLALLYIAL